jgi:DNA-binding response OmpR family regulator
MAGANDTLCAQSLSRPLILVVEDEALIAIEIAYILNEAGFDVLGPAARVLPGLELLQRYGCDAAVLDIRLGAETSEPIALELTRQGVPFVTLSCYSKEQRPPAFDGAPALSKPINGVVLADEIRRCLLCNGPRPGDPLQLKAQPKPLE